MGRGPKAHHLWPEHHHAVIPVLGFMIQCDLNRHSLLGSGSARIMPAHDGEMPWTSGAGAQCFLVRQV
jgi:hypothetical protein